MIYIRQGQQNQIAATCSRNGFLTGSTIYYLWDMTHKLSGKNYRFVPFRVQPSVSYSVPYDLFCWNVDPQQPNAFLTGATSCGQTNVGTLLPGEYEVNIWEQYSDANTDPLLASDIVQQNLATVVGVNQNVPTTYTGGTDGVFIIYNDNND
jgi:hypothetical protein